MTNFVPGAKVIFLSGSTECYVFGILPNDSVKVIVLYGSERFILEVQKGRTGMVV
jgi:hypothetical protein